MPHLIHPAFEMNHTMPVLAASKPALKIVFCTAASSKPHQCLHTIHHLSALLSYQAAPLLGYATIQKDFAVVFHHLHYCFFDLSAKTAPHRIFSFYLPFTLY